ncbi:MAG: hypothetical protein AAFV53_16095 [Myxococcota bacterium]
MKRLTPLIIAIIVIFGLACGSGGGNSSSEYDDGCSDGRGIGYANGLSQGENCLTFDDDPGPQAFDTGSPDYNEGYVDCYPDGYADGYDEGSASSGCR